MTVNKPTEVITNSPIALMAFPFRPFFLLAALYAIISITGWIAYLFFGLQIPTAWQITQWHTHEMIYGFVSAAIAGFLLTAMCNWTGAAPLKGTKLFLLVLLWIAGRIAMWTSNVFPQEYIPTNILAASLDALFLPCVTCYALSVLIRYKNKRNLIMGAMLAVLSIGNIMMHYGAFTNQLSWVKHGESLGLSLIMLLMIIIGGRVIPFFTRSWLTRTGKSTDYIKTHAIVDALAIGSVIAFIILIQFTQSSSIIFSITIFAFIANTLRLIGWSGWICIKEPLLWILHLAYFWVAIALLLRGLGAINIVGHSVWVHALGVGGIGTMILGIMTRVSLGHTGRSLTLPPHACWIYTFITLAAVIRVTTAMYWMNYQLGIMLTAIMWVLAFGLFLYLYFPILTAPRADGKPG